MSKNDDLERAVASFKTIEMRLAELAGQTEAVAGAGQRLGSAQEALQAVHALVAEALGQHAALAEQLATLASDLAGTTEVVRRGDPSRMFEAVEHLTADFERQKERISEMAGEVRARIEQETHAIDTCVASSTRETKAAMELHAAAITDAVSQSKAEISNAVTASREALTMTNAEHDKSMKDDAARWGRRLWAAALAAAALSGIAVVLLIVAMVTS
jgi:hypothetical protein